VAIPRPGKEPLKRWKRVKGPVYRHCSLCTHEYVAKAVSREVSIILSRPWVALGAVRGGCGELLGVKAGDGGACHCDGAAEVSGVSSQPW
jgi:hypothetical protein